MNKHVKVVIEVTKIDEVQLKAAICCVNTILVMCLSKSNSVKFIIFGVLTRVVNRSTRLGRTRKIPKIKYAFDLILLICKTLFKLYLHGIKTNRFTILI